MKLTEIYLYVSKIIFSLLVVSKAMAARGRRAAKAAWWSKKCQGHGAPRLCMLPKEWEELEAEFG